MSQTSLFTGPGIMSEHKTLIAQIREFLTKAFSDDDLTTLCFDYFRYVYDGFASGMTKWQKIHILIERCEPQLYKLLAAIKCVRPEQYAEHQFPQVPTGEISRQERDPQQVFISYDQSDSKQAHQLTYYLRKQGIRVWIAPDNIVPGEKWEEAIQRGLSQSGVFVVVLTPAAIQSDWVQAETLQAAELERQARMRLILLEIERCDVPPWLDVGKRIQSIGHPHRATRLLTTELIGKPTEVARKSTGGRTPKKPSWPPQLQDKRNMPEHSILIDLPEGLQPVVFLQDVEDGLTGGPSVALQQYKARITECKDRDCTAKASAKIEEVWQQVPQSDATALWCVFLRLADWYWRNGYVQDVARYCTRVIEHLPDESATPNRIAKAVAFYMLGLSNHAQGNILTAVELYLKATELLKVTCGYWQLVGGNTQARLCGEVLTWMQKLIRCSIHVHLDQPTSQVALATLIYPWRVGKEAKLVLAELPLIKLISKSEVTGPKSDFLSERSRTWHNLDMREVDGYQVGTKLQVLGLGNNDALRPFYLRILNPDAKSGTDLLLPSGTEYSAFPVDNAWTLPGIDTKPGDYLLTYKTNVPNVELPGLLQHKESGDMGVGTFERDLANNVHLKEILKPPRFLAEKETIFSFYNIDFILRPA